MSTKSLYNQFVEWIREHREQNDLGWLRTVATNNSEPGSVGYLIKQKARRAFKAVKAKQRQQRRENRKRLAAKVRQRIADHGRVCLSVRAMDCDHYETTTLRVFKSHDDFFEWYLGEATRGYVRFQMRILTESEAEQFESSQCDHAIAQTYEYGDRDPGVPIQ